MNQAANEKDGTRVIELIDHVPVSMKMGVRRIRLEKRGKET